MTATHTNRPIIEIDAVSKRYRVGTLGASSLREAFRCMFAGGRKLAATQDFGARKGDLPGTFWSLRDVNLSVQRGEVVGLIGKNGAGKSTLLKLISRITEPTKGRITLRGRIASLLEVGTGFHPELTGRENIFLNGAILGMKRWEIQAKFDEIVEFSEVGNFLDTPVKRYSSGMFVRLAFAVAAHLEPEILLIDEVLAVGDAGFQQKCLGKVSEISERDGRTVFFVSHNLAAIRSLCSRAVLFEDGTVKMSGSPEDVIAQYLASSLQSHDGVPGHLHWGGGDDAPGMEDLRLHSLTLKNADGQVSGIFDADAPIHVELRYRVVHPLRGARMLFSVFTAEGDVAMVLTDHEFQKPVLAPGDYCTRIKIPGGVFNRRAYSIAPSADAPGLRHLMPLGPHLPFTVAGPANHLSQFPERWPGIVSPRVKCTVETPETQP